MLDPRAGFRSVIVAGVLAVVAAACGPAEDAASQDSGEQLSIVAVTSILGSIVDDLVGDEADVTVLMGPGVDPHTYQASARDGQLLRDADLVVANGPMDDVPLEENLFDLLTTVGSEGVTIFDFVSAIDPLLFAGHDQGNDDDHGHEGDQGHSHDVAPTGEIGEFKILDRGADHAVMAYVEDAQWHGEIPPVEVGAYVSLGAVIESADGRDRDLSEPNVNDFGVALASDAADGVVEFVDHGDHVDIRGFAEGETEVVFSWTHRGELRYTTPPMPVTVSGGHSHNGEGDDHDSHDNEDDDHGHDDHDHAHGDIDPHFWWDLARVADGVEQLALAIAAVDTTRSDDFWLARGAEVAQTYRDLDAEIVQALSVLDNASRVIVTNHDAFGYFADRYDFTIRATVVPGASTDVQANPRAFAQLIDVLVDEEIRVIFAENTDSTRLAEQLATQAEGEGLTDVAVVQLYTDALGPEGSGAETYVGMVRTTVDLILDALG